MCTKSVLVLFLALLIAADSKADDPIFYSMNINDSALHLNYHNCNETDDKVYRDEESCYVMFSSRKRNASEAERFCAQSSGHLATFANSTALKALIHNQFKGFISLIRVGTNSDESLNWAWLEPNGQKIEAEVTDWTGDEPNGGQTENIEYNVFFDNDGLYDAPGDYEQAAVCEYERPVNNSLECYDFVVKPGHAIVNESLIGYILDGDGSSIYCAWFCSYRISPPCFSFHHRGDGVCFFSFARHRLDPDKFQPSAGYSAFYRY